MNPARLRAYLMLLAVAVIWGIASPIIKFTLQSFDPAVFLAYRFFMSTILAFIIFYFNGFRFPKKLSTIALTFVYAFLNSVVALGFLFFGMNNTTVLDMTLITLLMPLIVSTAGVYFLNERVTTREKIGIAIAILGTILTVIEPIFANGGSGIKLSGNLLVLGYVATSAVTAVIAKKLLRQNVEPITLVNSSFIVGFISFTALILSSNPLIDTLNSISNASVASHIGVFYMAIISGTLAFWLSNKAQKTIEIGEQSLFSYLSPLISFPIAILWLGEKVTAIMVVGGVIIAIGVAIAETKTSIVNRQKKRYNQV